MEVLIFYFILCLIDVIKKYYVDCLILCLIMVFDNG